MISELRTHNLYTHRVYHYTSTLRRCTSEFANLSPNAEAQQRPVGPRSVAKLASAAAPSFAAWGKEVSATTRPRGYSRVREVIWDTDGPSIPPRKGCLSRHTTRSPLRNGIPSQPCDNKAWAVRRLPGAPDDIAPQSGGSSRVTTVTEPTELLAPALRGCRSQRPATRFVIHSRRICVNLGRTFVRCRNCLATRICERRKSTLTYCNGVVTLIR